LGRKIEGIKKDILYFILSFIIFSIILEIVFYKESLISIIRAVLSLYWLFAIPGILLSYLIFEKLEFVERFVIGTLLGAILTGIPAYYLGLLGIPIQKSIFILPAAYMLIFLGLMFFLEKK